MNPHFARHIVLLTLVLMASAAMSQSWSTLSVPMGAGVGKISFSSTSMMLDVPMQPHQTANQWGGAASPSLRYSYSSPIISRANQRAHCLTSGTCVGHTVSQGSGRAICMPSQQTVSVQIASPNRRASSESVVSPRTETGPSQAIYGRLTEMQQFSRPAEWSQMQAVMTMARRAPGAIYTTWVNWLDANHAAYTWILEDGIYYLDDADMYQAYLDWKATMSDDMASLFTFGQWKEWFMSTDNTSIYQYRAEPLGDALWIMIIMLFGYALVMRRRHTSSHS